MRGRDGIICLLLSPLCEPWGIHSKVKAQGIAAAIHIDGGARSCLRRNSVNFPSQERHRGGGCSSTSELVGTGGFIVLYLQHRHVSFSSSTSLSFLSNLNCFKKCSSCPYSRCMPQNYPSIHILKTLPITYHNTALPSRWNPQITKTSRMSQDTLTSLSSSMELKEMESLC
jgi:hypothetical protein